MAWESVNSIFTSQSNHQSSPHPSSFFFLAAPSPAGAAVALFAFLIALVPTVLFCCGGLLCSPPLGTPKLSQKSFRAGSALAPEPDRVFAAAAAAALSCPSTNLWNVSVAPFALDATPDETVARDLEAWAAKSVCASWERGVSTGHMK